MTDKYAQIAAKNAAKFNQDHASVLYSGKHRILRKELNQNNQWIYSFLKQNDFKGIHQNQLIEESKDTNIPATTAWLKHPDCAWYPGGVFLKPVPYGAPNPFKNDLDKRRFNLWQGFTVKPEKGNETEEEQTNLIYEHVQNVICSEDEELFLYVMRWIAYTFQNPDKPAGVALVLRGEKGTGKGILGNFLLKLWGSHGEQVGHHNLTKKFNAQLSNACFVFADEVFVSGNKSDEATLKMLITEPNITIEPKGIDSYSQPNYLKVLMATNESYVVPASKDERRYCVVDVSSSHMGDTAYFNQLLQACNSPQVQANFLNDMLFEIDLTDFDIRKIPETKALRDQRMMSLNSVGQWLLDGLMLGVFFGLEDWYSICGTSTLYDSYTKWANVHSIKAAERMSSAKMSEYLAKVGYKKKRQRDTEGKEHRGYILGSVEEAKDTFKKHEKL